MSSVGRVVGSVNSFTNENTATLINFNLDLTLFRCEPLAEFQPVGSALTTRRKEEAETGQTHKTACKLGFLLNDIIPDTPALRKAYGKRVGEILTQPDTNPQGTENDGPFRPFIGADCTSIWAAATSGDAAIGVLLLTCMLADAFDAKTAVSIWSELIDERKRNIQFLLENNKIVNPNTVAAAQQDITRSELRTWDASARSWLRRADLAMRRQKTQFTLIAENIAIPYPGGSSVFERVTTTWIRAMEVLEKLLDNNPQQACDRAILSGISSWHLYPDLLVFQTEARRVPFNDVLIPSSGLLSLGLEYRGTPSDSFIRWSLALSHLRYYGDPVQVKSNETLSRVNMSDMWLLALGSLLRHWSVPYTNLRTGMAWFEQLGRKLRHSSRWNRVELSWLLRLCDGVTNLRTRQNEMAEKLIKYGFRRGANLLGSSNKITTQMPFFGLCNRACFSAIAQVDETDIGIEWLRRISCQVNLAANDAVISFSGRFERRCYTEWATIKPVQIYLAECSSKETTANESESRLVRWIHCPLQEDEVSLQAILQKRAQTIQQRGEICILITHDRGFLNDEPYPEQKRPVWHNPPQLLQVQEPLAFYNILGGQTLGFGAYDLWIKSTRQEGSHWDRRIQDAIGKHCYLDQGLSWITSTPHTERITSYLLSYLCQDRSASRAEASQKRKRSASETPDPIEPSSFQRDIKSFNVMTNLIRRSPELIAAVRALEVADRLYKTLPGATISLRIIEQDLLKACWLPASIKSIVAKSTDPKGSRLDAFSEAISTPIEHHIEVMTRQDSFACVAMFESGRFNIDPSRLTEVIALCYENSIFVAEILLSDPSIDASKLGLTHMVGNVGHAGMVFMISPIDPRVRQARHDTSLVDHRQYDNSVADKLRGTSLHLSFTTWKMPLDWENTGEIDQEVFLLESVVSVQDNGTWVADIDVLERERDSLDVVTFQCDCPASQCPPSIDAVSLDNWEELLDPPPCVGVLRAKDNWAARLAATSILIQQARGHVAIIIKGGRICWRCLDKLYAEPEPHFPQVLIY